MYWHLNIWFSPLTEIEIEDDTLFFFYPESGFKNKTLYPITLQGIQKHALISLLYGFLLSFLSPFPPPLNPTTSGEARWDRDQGIPILEIHRSGCEIEGMDQSFLHSY